MEDAAETDGTALPEEQSLSLPAAEGGVSPVHAIADALRANAEALRRIDQNQRRIAESVEKSDKAMQVVTSTRALNETFRGLTDVQRGLLDAVVRQRGGGRGIGFAFLAVTILACVLGFLIYDRLTSGSTVSRETYEAARAQAEQNALELGRYRGAESGAREREAALQRTASEKGQALATAERATEDANRRVRELETVLAEKSSQLQNYLAVKDMADSAGSIQMQNMQLQREITDLRSRLSQSEKERERLYEMLAAAKIESRQGDPEAIKKAASDLGVIPPEATAAPAAGPAVLSARDKRKIRMQLNRLLGAAPGEEIYEILDFGEIGPTGALLDARVGRYLNQQMLNSLMCKELDIRFHRDQDALELRFKDGAIVNTRTPAESIPFEEGGHSVFVRKVGIDTWLKETARNAEIDADGRLTWKTTAS